MNITEAEALHVELLQNLPGTGYAIQLLTEIAGMHAPKETGREVVCSTCFGNDEEPLPWLWCRTLALLNRYAGIDTLNERIRVAGGA